jgi:hypothetical protein
MQHDSKSSALTTRCILPLRFLNLKIQNECWVVSQLCTSYYRGDRIMATILLSERLNLARQHQFVGRQQECSFLQSVLRSPELSLAVLHIFGPSGVGKTTLLHEFQRLCCGENTSIGWIDARNFDPSPASFLAALKAALGLETETDLFQRLAAQEHQNFQTGRLVLMIDTYELLLPLDDWLRETFLPQMSSNVLVVLAGRYPPSLPWRTDPGWQTLLHSLSLRNFSPSESQTYLVQRQIPATHHAAVLNFTHGYPLALSLLADVFAQKQNTIIQPEEVPDVIKILLDKFLEDVPSLLHRQALEALAIVRLTTENLLAELLAIPDAHYLFTWLQGLSFIESGPIGIFPHDLAREVLIADLRWRNPDVYTELHQRARTYYCNRLEQKQGPEQHRLLFDYVFLHQNNTSIKSRFVWQEQSGLWVDGLQEGDRPALLEMVNRHEGPASAQWADYWLRYQPQGVRVVRDLQQRPVGFFQIVALQDESFEILDADPATIACWQYLQRHAPLRPGEQATLFRFWMAQETYQDVSAIQSLIFITLVQYYRNTPSLAYTFLPCADPDFWTEMFTYADLVYLTNASFEVGGKIYGVYGHDWRVVSPTAWQELLALREIAASTNVIPTQNNATLLVLSQTEFCEAVQDALRSFTRSERLHGNPLLRSRLISDAMNSLQVENHEPMMVLKKLLQEAIETLQASPRDDKLYRVLYRTYLQPAMTQEKAAESLDLPFSSYRRYLKTGVMLVAERLWQKEIV